MSFVDKLKKYYDLTDEEYAALTAAPSFSSIPTLENEENAIKMKERIFQAVEKKEKTIIYGDYDCDGIMATSIMAYALRKIGLPAANFIPSRYLDGYGINLANAKKIKEAGYQLLICVDNGVSAFEALEYLKEEGIDVLIIDHHELQDSLPPNLACVHPITSSYGQYPVSAGYLAFIFSIMLLGEVDEYLLVLGALATLGDMMPLKGHNREIVRLAIKYINENHYPQINNIIRKDNIDVEDLAMSLIPMINAIGRMIEENKGNRLVAYFSTLYTNQSARIARWMEEVNEERKGLTKLAMENLEIEENPYFVFAYSKYKEGLNGLFANQLLNHYGKAILVYSKKENTEDAFVASMRCYDGLSVVECFEENSDKLLVFGGHELAGGCSFASNKLDEIKESFTLKSKNNPQKKKAPKYIEIEENEANEDNIKLTLSLAPFGQDWPSPKFKIINLNKNKFSYIQNGKYLSFILPNRVKVFSFRIGEKEVAENYDKDILFSFRKNEFKGKISYQLLAEDFI